MKLDRQAIFRNGSYAIFIIIMLVFNILIFAVPFLAFSDPPGTDTVYPIFGLSCHQLTSRSLCIFKSSSSYRIDDCYAQQGVLVLSKENHIVRDGMEGYKIPVCARDIAIYLAMLAGGLIFPLHFKIDTVKWPNKWLLAIALIPIAIDGTTQLFGMQESTNAMRLFTGAITGFAIPFYLIPMLNAIVQRFVPKAKK
jgi:uncharacterized membrane protein